ncbi:Aste57867_11420 [Aphanomyces stellatus]|uniref:Aste57867_11420 protein n=1 Tax=Aphanomyces stellatus TaxID=120398 RepID=A0A485KTF7_9STRA|nr:hypothetical protein As57867_011378 [Aphanomyces stellatus]VFT88281.1 Aste57867_11420 [Aphanomyces stellatus]
MGKRKGNGGSGSNASDLRMQKKHKQNHQHGGKKAPMQQLYTLQDAILVLGDGDFTFSRGLVTHRGGGANLYATSFDSSTQVRKKYSNANDCITAIVEENAVVLHDIDATKLEKLPAHVPPLVDYIIFNFPHSGQQRVHINRVLLLDFFESARSKLKFKGEVHITLKTKPPYSNWNVEDQAKESGFVMKERRPFRIDAFPGYHHRTTDPQAKTFEPDQCITYVFVVNRVKYPVPTINPSVFTPVASTNAPQPATLSAAVVAPRGTFSAATKQAFKDALAATSPFVNNLTKSSPTKAKQAVRDAVAPKKPATKPSSISVTKQAKPMKAAQHKKRAHVAVANRPIPAHVTAEIHQLCLDFLRDKQAARRQ